MFFFFFFNFFFFFFSYSIVSLSFFHKFLLRFSQFRFAPDYKEASPSIFEILSEVSEWVNQLILELA